MIDLITLYTQLLNTNDPDPIYTCRDRIATAFENGTVAENYELMSSIQTAYSTNPNKQSVTVDTIDNILHLLAHDLEQEDLTENWRYCIECGNFENLTCHGPFARGRWFECQCGHQFFFQGKSDVESTV